MGSSCSRIDKPDAAGHVEEDQVKTPHLTPTTSKLVKNRHLHPRAAPVADAYHSDASQNMAPAWDTVAALDRTIEDRSRDLASTRSERAEKVKINLDKSTRHGLTNYVNADDYLAQRKELKRREEALSFENACRKRASELERRANDILQAAKENDKAMFKREPPFKGYAGQLHERYPGDHYLGNVALINRSEVFKIARRMPKGAHLHIHFNACLMPNVLLDIAKSMERMFITSDLPLVDENNFQRCEIQFNILPPAKEKPGDLFSKDYTDRQTMRFKEFLERFPTKQLGSVDKWLQDKLVFQPEEANGLHQTQEGYVASSIRHSVSH
jgi:adenosine deaminase CECR1